MATFELKGWDDLVANIAATIAYAKGADIKRAVYVPAAAAFERQLTAAAPDARVSSRVPEQETTPIRDAIDTVPGPDAIPNVLVVVDADRAPEANAVEYGTGERYTRAGAYRGSMPAHPFFRPTVRVERPNVVADVGDGWLKEITDPTKFPGSRSL